MLQKDAVFREICDEYEEMCTWLTSQHPVEPRSPKEYRDARELIQDLEDEIRKALKETEFEESKGELQ